MDALAKNMKDMRSKEALAQTEDVEMVKLFIEKLPDARVAQSQIFVNSKLDLGKQTTNINNWIYNPVGYFERIIDEETQTYSFWVNTVKNRGGKIKKYNANVAKEISEFIYLDKLQPYEKYYTSLAPAYIEFDKNGNMISSYIRMLKTEDLSSVGGIIVQGKRPYQAYSYDIIALKTYLRKLQMNKSKNFFEENLLDENIITSEVSKEHIKPASVNDKSGEQINIERIIINNFNKQNNTNFATMAEVQKHLSSQAN